MTDRIAIFLGVVLIAAIAADIAFGWGGLVFAMKKFNGLVEWIAFWR